MIKVNNLYHKYKGNDVYAVKDVGFYIDKGEIYGFLGPSGAGKSTVQKILCGILNVQKGNVKYNDTEIKKMKGSFFEKIGVSFEFPNLYEKLTGYENLNFFRGLFKSETEDPNLLLERVGLSDSANKKVKDYSKGMKQRLVFARSIINKPEILFLDEPLSGLDPTTAKNIKNIINEKRKLGTTIFLTTHNMYVADELCDRVAFLNEGEIIASDTPKNLKLKYGTSSIKIEYKTEQKKNDELLFIEKEEDKNRFKEIIDKYEIITLHSGEATLEEIFIKLTGRELI